MRQQKKFSSLLSIYHKHQYNKKVKRAIVCIPCIAAAFLFFSNQTAEQVIYEQPAIPEKIIILPPKKIDSTPPPSEPTQSLEQKPATRPTLPKLATAILPPLPPPKPIPQSELYAKGLLATVNFLCPIKDATYTVATGALIDARGYIISNAHIIDKNNIRPTCTIRTGSPAVEIGKAKLVFVPSDYFVTTDEQLRARMDISIWKLEGARANWPHWEIDFDTISAKDEQLLTQSYPAELLSSELVFKGLNLLFSNTAITEANASIIASRATIAAQHGSSGGVLIDPYTGKLRGIIFGISSDTTQAINERTLYAITPSRISTIAWQETKKQFREYLAVLPEPAY